MLVPFRFRKRTWFKQAVNTEQGFSMVELLVAMVILLILLIAFTPLFTRSIEMISYAGDKTEALHLGQSDMEVTIAEKKTVDGHELIFDFGDTVITIPGGLVEVEKEKGSAETFLSGFIPYVPAINLYLNPLPLVEGYDQLDIIVMGRDTDHGKVNQAKMYNSSGVLIDSHVFYSPLVSNPVGLPEGYDEYGYFTLPAGLRNEHDPFITEIEWQTDNNIVITARARLQVVLPYAVAAGSEQSLIISPDVYQIWKGRSHGLGIGLGTINDVVWTGFEYLAVTGNGNVLLWGNREPVKQAYYESGTSWNAVISGSGLYVAVGSGGKIIISWNGETWVSRNTGSYTLHDIAWNETVFMAVGSDGTILTSTDGETWATDLSAGSDITFYGIDYGKEKWIAVGNDLHSGEAVVYRKEGEVWGESFRVEETVLLSVAYAENEYLAVGRGGTMLLSADGLSWEKLTTTAGNNYTENDLHAVIWDDIRGQYISEKYQPQYIVVGDGGTIMTKVGGKDWEILTVSPAPSIRGVAVR